MTVDYNKALSAQAVLIGTIAPMNAGLTLLSTSPDPVVSSAGATMAPAFEKFCEALQHMSDVVVQLAEKEPH